MQGPDNRIPIKLASSRDGAVCISRTVWLRHTLKMIASDSCIGIMLMTLKLKELECYDALASAIKDMRLSPDPDIFPRHLWPGRNRKPSGCSCSEQPGQGLLQGYFSIILNAYNEPSPSDTRTTPGEAAWPIFKCDRQPATQEESYDESIHTRHNFRV